MANYNYSISADFNDNINLSQFHKEININANISQNIIGVSTNNDNVIVTFDNILSTDEQIVLDNIVSSHVPEEIINLPNTITSNPRNDIIKSTEYRRMCTFVFPGSTHCLFKSHSYMSSTLTSYSIKVYDMTYKKLIIEKTLTNTEENPIILGMGINIPKYDAIFEVSAKKTGLGSAHLESITIHYP